MKRLFIVRHAKSSWDYPVLDHVRPLKKRGNNDALSIAKHTVNKFTNPELVLCSTAVRTRETAAYFINEWGLNSKNILYKKELYDFEGTQLLLEIKKCKTTVNSLMIFGHNFAITDFVNIFGNINIAKVPTCGFLVLDFDINNWSELAPNQGIVRYKVFPKEIK